jgi:archaellum component FlaC
MTVEERVLRLENAFTILVELARNQEERLDDNNARADDFDAKLSALADAHIRTEESLHQLAGRVGKLAETVERLISEGRKGK